MASVEGSNVNQEGMSASALFSSPESRFTLFRKSSFCNTVTLTSFPAVMLSSCSSGTNTNCCVPMVIVKEAEFAEKPGTSDAIRLITQDCGKEARSGAVPEKVSKSGSNFIQEGKGV